MSINGYDLVVEAEEWIGTPWKHQQSNKGVGCDCIGLVRGVGRNCGIANVTQFDADVRFQGYGAQPVERLLLQGAEDYLDRVLPGHIDLGDIALIRYGKAPIHFAFITALNPVYVIHAVGRWAGSKSSGTVIKHRVDDIWDARIMRLYRFRGLA